MTLLGVSFAMLVTPLTAAVLSSLGEADEGLASGVNNAVSAHRADGRHCACRRTGIISFG